LHGEAPDFGRGRGLGFWMVACPGNEEVRRGNTVRWRVPRRVGKGRRSTVGLKASGRGGR
jgi:hypothetical protein